MSDRDDPGLMSRLGNRNGAPVRYCGHNHFGKRFKPFVVIEYCGKRFIGFDQNAELFRSILNFLLQRLICPSDALISILTFGQVSSHLRETDEASMTIP